jgi:hypothetical protein
MFRKRILLPTLFDSLDETNLYYETKMVLSQEYLNCTMIHKV